MNEDEQISICNGNLAGDMTWTDWVFQTISMVSWPRWAVTLWNMRYRHTTEPMFDKSLVFLLLQHHIGIISSFSIQLIKMYLTIWWRGTAATWAPVLSCKVGYVGCAIHHPCAIYIEHMYVCVCKCVALCMRACVALRCVCGAADRQSPEQIAPQRHLSILNWILWLKNWCNQRNNSLLSILKCELL